MRLKLSPLRLALCAGVLVSIVRWSGCGFLELIDSRTVDYRLLQRGVQPASSEVVIVAVDDASLAEIGRWPWPRRVRAQLIRRLEEAGAAVIGVDAVDSEAGTSACAAELPERFPGVAEEQWTEFRTALLAASQDDRELAEAIRDSGRTVLGYFFNLDGPFGPTTARASRYNAVQSADRRGHRKAIEARSVVGNLPELNEAAREVGYFNVVPDSDGFVRRYPLVIRFGEEFFLPLPLAMLRVYRPESPLALRFAEFGVEAVRFGTRAVPVAENGEMLLNYRGPGHTFRHVSAVDVLAGRVPAEVFRDRLVLIGVTARAVYDIRVTPFDPVFPGVEIHATVLDNILRGDFLWQPKLVVVFEIAIILGLCIFLGVSLRRLRGMWGSAVGFGLLAGYFVGSQWIFLWYRVPLSLAYPFLAIFFAYAAVVVHQYMVEERKKRTLRNALELHLSPAVARHVRSNPDMMRLGGEKRTLSVLFSDIRGFTSMSERLEPELLVDLLNGYFSRMTEVIFRYHGTLDKFMGDGLMAVWGAPVPSETHARDACLAALDMVRALAESREGSQERRLPTLDIGIGINTGPMVVGNMGSTRRLSYTVIGDNVNIGSRLEGLTKTYSVRIIASVETVRAAGSIVARELDLVRVKGRTQPAPIFEVLGAAEEGARWRPLIEQFRIGLQLYRDRNWAEAMAYFAAILEEWPEDGPSKLYVARCRKMLDAPPPVDWDGVTTMETK